MRPTSLSIPSSIALAAVLLSTACGQDSNTADPVDDVGTGGTSIGGNSGGGEGGSGGGGCIPDPELCDGVDNNCDGEIDEGCLCSNGDTRPCFTGEEATLDVGLCVEGVQTCDETGTWGTSCDGEVTAVPETCDGADNDCNGSTDEGFGSVTCGLGICQVTIEECVEGVPNPCIPGTADPTETCNGIDDTCEGDIDEGCTCTTSQTQSCYSGAPGTQDVGECSSGLQTCQNGTWGPCAGETTVVPELCDSLDNDCDGTPDNGNPEGGGGCNTGLLGVCAAGIEACQGGSLACNQLTASSPETCDSLDNDCNGAADDGDPGGGADCTINGQMGLCADGTEHCVNGIIDCTADFPNAPISELCNGLDDDCDGTADDGNPEGGASCSTGLLGICAAGTQSCVNATLVCQQTNSSTTEICNNQDDDCDGPIDEGNPGGGGSCSTGLLGVCAAGTYQCSGGTTTCEPNTPSSSEVCGNVFDEDCDGNLDNGCTGCGDGVLDSGEACDDHNTSNNDGCSSTCTIEAGYCCSGQPSTCTGGPAILAATSLAVSIPDGSYNGTINTMGCVDLILDTCAGTITDMDVALGVTHSWVGDTTFRIISPASTTTTLMHRPGYSANIVGHSANLIATTLINFNDGASADAEDMGSTLLSTETICVNDSICDYFPNPDGDPGTNLAAFNGQAIAGTWTVCGGDSGASDTGTLETVQLSVAFN